MVTAAGQTVVASRTQNADLLAASCGGGGGNFGARAVCWLGCDAIHRHTGGREAGGASVSRAALGACTLPEIATRRCTCHTACRHRHRVQDSTARHPTQHHYRHL